MRAVVLLVASLVATGALAGCIGGDDGEDPVNQTGLTDNPTGNLPGTQGGGVVKVLAALSSKVEASGPQWVKAGTAVPVSATVPSNAKGNVTFTWAVGPLPGTATPEAIKLDTGVIDPGAEATLQYKASGLFQMHCHPHPDMRHNVTVVEGYQGPAVVHVQIVDGATASEYRFIPENVVVGVDTKVVYHNNGTQPHTSTLLLQEPALKLAPVEGASGEVTVDGEGWQRIVAVLQDEEGRIGSAEAHVYVTSDLPSFAGEKVEFSFPVGGAPSSAVAPVTKSFTLAHGGWIFLNWTATDAGSAAGQSVSEIEIHVRQQGETQDAITTSGDLSGSQSAKVPAGTYTIEIVPASGANIEGSADVQAVYELVPPDPSTPTSGGDDDHGGGGGHNH